MEADRKTGRRKAAGNGDGGDSGKIGWAIEAKEKRARGVVFTVKRGGFFADEWRRDWGGWDNERVDFGFGKRGMKLLKESFALLYRFEIGGCCDTRANFKAGADVFAVVGGIFWKPAHLLMVASGFGPGDVVSGGFRVVEKRDGDFLYFAAGFAEKACRGFETSAYIL